MIDFSNYNLGNTPPKPTTPAPTIPEKQPDKIDFSNFHIETPKIPDHAPVSDRSSPHFIQALITSTAKKLGIPLNIALKQAETESNFNPDAINMRSGAIGVYQIVPKFHPEVKNPRDITENILGGLSYLKKLHEQFGNWPEALAAYNAGPGNVGNKQWLKFAETTGYVDKILGKGASLSFSKGEYSRFGALPLKPVKPPTGIKYWESLVSSSVGGVLKGLTGLPIRLRTWNLHGGGDIYAVSTEEQKKLEKLTEPLPENKTLSGIGEIAGTLMGISAFTRLGTAGAVRIFPSATRVGVSAGVEMLLAPGNIASKIVGSEAVKLLAPVAFGVGGQTALKQSVDQIYNKGYLNPVVVGEEAAFNAGLVFLFPGAAALFSKGLSAAAGLSSELMRFIPASLGGAPVSRQAMQAGMERLTMGRIFMAPWTYAATQLQALYRNNISKLPTSIADHLTWVNTLGKTMDGLTKAVSNITFPTRMFGLNSSFPVDSPIKPQQILQSLDLAPRFGKLTEGDQTSVTNFGGGVSGGLFHSRVAEMLDKLGGYLKTSAIKEERNNAHHAMTAAKILRNNAGSISPSALRPIIKALDNLIDMSPNTRFKTTYFGVGGQRIPTPTMEGRFLVFLKKLFVDQSLKGSAVSKLTRGTRSIISNVLLGMGNFASGITVMNRLSFPLATEGSENVAYALNHVRTNSDLYNRFIKSLGVARAHTLLVPGEPVKEGLISKYSFIFYDKAERVTLPATAIARFKTLIDKGVPYAKAVQGGLDYARQLRTSMDYDWPSLLSGGHLANVAKVLFQFAPFGMKSLAFAGSLDIEHFANYAGYMFMMGGIKSVPFATVLDRMIAGYTGHSIINSALANPHMQQILTGIPGLEFGVDIGSRHNWSQAFFDRWLGASQPASVAVTRNLFGAYSNLLMNPNGANYIKALKASAHMGGMGYIANALDDEKHGAILDSHGFPELREPTKEELAAVGLGLVPERLSSYRALQQSEFEAEQFHRRATSSYEETYARSLTGGNRQEIRDAARDAAKHGISHATLLDIKKRVFNDPAWRLFRKLPKFLRPDFTQLTRQHSEENK